MRSKILKWHEHTLDAERSDGAVQIWRILLPCSSRMMEQFKKNLSDDELIRLEKFHFNLDQERWIASRGGLRKILGDYLKMPPKIIHFDYTDFGKPYLKGSQLRFNVAHTIDYIVYAIVENDDIGVDIEQFNDQIDFITIAQNFFSENECQQLFSLSPQKRPLAFYRCWTIKEAILKAMGLGLHIPLDQLELDFVSSDHFQLRRFWGVVPKAPLWKLEALPCGDRYIASFATKKNYNKVYLWDLEKHNQA
jgi:4'-phosphopantetheinyl transferase